MILIRYDNKVFVFGNNSHYQLGVDNNELDKLTEIPNFTAVKYFNKNCTTIFIDEDNNAYICGDNQKGRLGLGHSNVVYRPTLIPNMKVKDASIGENHILFLCENGTLHMNQLGITKPMETDIKFVQIASGNGHVLALSEDNYVYGWGDNSRKQLYASRDNYYEKFIKISYHKALKVAAKGCSSIFISEKNEVYVSGNNFYGELGTNGTNRVIGFTKIEKFNASDVFCSPNYTIFINESNEAFGCGYNVDNLFGLSRNYYIYITPTKLPIVDPVSVSCYSHYTVFITKNGDVVLCGDAMQKHFTKEEKQNGPLVIPDFIHYNTYWHRFKVKSAQQ